MSIDKNVLDDLIEMLIERTLVSPIQPTLLKDTCEWLERAGLRLLRVNMSWGTLHPTVGALTLKWWRHEESIDVLRYLHADDKNDEWLSSPGYHVISNRLNNLDISLEQDYAHYPFPLLDDLKEAGGTHYVLTLFAFSEEAENSYESDGMFISWLSDRKGGFTTEERQALKRIEKYIAVALKMALRERIIRNTLTAYLGENAATRVMKGSIHLGDGEIIPAVIWYSDLRKSTDLGDKLPGPELLATLNDYFSCTAGAVMDHGGEVLRFVGDAVLAIFPCQDTSLSDACNNATMAAMDALERMASINEVRQKEGKESLAFGLGLHMGELMFGNIGVPERLDFSVTGPAANEAARIETLTKEIQLPVLASKEFVDHAPPHWKLVGQYPMRGIKRAIEIFTLK